MSNKQLLYSIINQRGERGMFGWKIADHIPLLSLDSRRHALKSKSILPNAVVIKQVLPHQTWGMRLVPLDVSTLPSCGEQLEEPLSWPRKSLLLQPLLRVLPSCGPHMFTARSSLQDEQHCPLLLLFGRVHISIIHSAPNVYKHSQREGTLLRLETVFHQQSTTWL